MFPMAKENSFDIVSQVDLQEVTNAINQAVKELKTRFDFKGSRSEIGFDGTEITLIGDDEFKLKNVVDILEARLVKRGINLKALRYGRIEPAAKDTVRQRVDLVQGLDRDIARVIIKLVKDSKLKVQASVQGEQVRISGKNRDDLQAIIKILKDQEFDIPLQFINYRSI
ncbi:MAG: putative nucleotide-binding protein [Firmicutes bacterium ADurb.Bin456]|nr:MAG: putative nucleotide-binding protein [Firmicutes bacterium ADurb.Bin456]